jgi:hypothetical protein
MYDAAYAIAVNRTTTMRCMGTTIPKNIALYSPTVKSDGPDAIILIMTIKIIEMIGDVQRNFLFMKKTDSTDKTGIRMKMMVLIKFKSNNTGRYQFIIPPPLFVSYDISGPFTR